jgi:hypothetical protein
MTRFDTIGCGYTRVYAILEDHGKQGPLQEIPMPAKKRTKKKTSGPGKKTCPSCGKVVGARTRRCACGHAFTLKRSAKRRTPLDYSLKELEQLVASKRKLVEPLQALIDKHGADVVLAETKRLAQ